MKRALIDFLENVMTDDRREQMRSVLSQRTLHLTVVLEDIYQTQNASAVLRTCDCFGVQDVHIIENRNTFDVNPKVVIGSSKWLSLKKYNQAENNTRQALQELKKEGYKIVATSPHDDDINLEDYPIENHKTALVFGTELTGISEIVKDEADAFIKIPMVGYSESLNISVAAAVSIHHLGLRLRNSNALWQLNEEESQNIHLDWLQKSIKKCELLVQEFYERNKVAK